MRANGSLLPGSVRRLTIVADRGDIVARNTRRGCPDTFDAPCNDDRASQDPCGGLAMGDRFQILTAGIEPESQKGLEFGALNNPIVDPSRGDVRFVDFTDIANLREQHRAFPERVNALVE